MITGFWEEKTCKLLYKYSELEDLEKIEKGGTLWIIWNAHIVNIWQFEEKERSNHQFPGREDEENGINVEESMRWRNGRKMEESSKKL